MDMSYSLFRYYYSLASDVNIFEPLIKELQAGGISLVNGSFLSEGQTDNRAGNQCRLLSLENMSVLTVEIKQAQGSWSSYLEEMTVMEEKSGVISDFLLGQVTVLTASDQDWNIVLEQGEELTHLQAVIKLKLNRGHLARLNWAWPHDQAFYICNLEEENRLDSRLLEQGLPLLEARLIKLHRIASLFRERQHAVIYEKEELDHKLSAVLHSNLVPEQAQQIETDDLELQVQELSASYGMLAGNYRIILEGASKLTSLISGVQRKLKNEPSFASNGESIDSFLSPYFKRLEGLKSTSEALQISHQNHQAAIDVVRSKIDLLMSRENIKLQTSIKELLEVNIAIQKQSLTLQVSAGLIEFIVLAYYSLSIWKYLSPDAFHKVPAWGQFCLIMSFAGVVVYATHLIAERMQGHRHINRKLAIACTLLLIIFSTILGLSIFLH